MLKRNLLIYVIPTLEKFRVVRSKILTPLTVVIILDASPYAKDGVEYDLPRTVLEKDGFSILSKGNMKIIGSKSNIEELMKILSAIQE